MTVDPQPNASRCPGLVEYRDDDDAALLSCCVDCTLRTTPGNVAKVSAPATFIGGKGWVCAYRLPPPQEAPGSPRRIVATLGSGLSVRCPTESA